MREDNMVREVLTRQQLNAMSSEEAAAFWTVRRAEGLTRHEASLLEEWLSSEPSHRETLEASGQVWQSFDDAEGDELLDAMREHARTAGPRRTRSIPQWAAAAAVLLLVLVMGSLLIPNWRSGPPDPAQSAALPEIRYVTARGEVKKVTLPDGSGMTLDADSVAAAVFTADRRAVRLARGRAFFEVQPNPARPFAVTAGRLEVVALGTKFDVGVRSDEVSVALLEGQVSVGPADRSAQPALLKPGQTFVERGGTAILRHQKAEAATAWRSGFAYFEDDTLVVAAAELNRYSKKQIVVRDPEVAALRVTGRFRTGDPERFVRVLEEIYPVRAVVEGDEIEILMRR
jgi:transmembrane sensor